MQHAATHCNTLQHTATHCNTLQNMAQPHPFAPLGITLQYIATHTCNTLSCHVASRSTCNTHCNALQHTTTRCCSAKPFRVTWYHSRLPTHTATHLQRTTTHCNALQHTTTPDHTVSRCERHVSLHVSCSTCGARRTKRHISLVPAASQNTRHMSRNTWQYLKPAARQHTRRITQDTCFALGIAMCFFICVLAYIVSKTHQEANFFVACSKSKHET